MQLCRYRFLIIAWRTCWRNVLSPYEWRTLFLHPSHSPFAPPLFATYFEENDRAEDAGKKYDNENNDRYSAL
jgi:hypothetical protein